MSRIDAHAGTRNLIENAFSHLTWYQAVCDRTGFKGISQIWQEEPAWYFWLHQARGAFLLRLHADEALADNQYVSLSLHYFPDRQDQAYQGLSAGEKWLLSDESVFDLATNTPRFEAYGQFRSLFMVAEVGLVFNQENRLQLLLYSSERELDEPASAFIDLLISTLNFYSKRHHRQACLLREGSVSTVLLNYSDPVFQLFLKDFELDELRLEPLHGDARSGRWSQYAHMDAACSMHGACSCQH